MTAEVLLSRLSSVRQTAPDRWLARCPAHADKTASLSVRELPDGRTLVHCFAGCGVDAVLAGANFEMQDLFPERPPDQRRLPERRPFPAQDVLKALAFEATIVLCAAVDMLDAGDLVLGPEGFARLEQAHERIQSALSLSYGGFRHG